MMYNFSSHEDIDSITRNYIITVAAQDIETIPITEINEFLNGLDAFERLEICEVVLSK
jgi:hypothetical protein